MSQHERPPADRSAAALHRLLAIMSALRHPETGCPWDLEQDFATIAPYTIEEAYEVADAIARADWPALLDELGDLLFQVVYYAQMGAEAGRFDFTAIAEAIATKMVRRHPHVFGEAAARDAAEQTHAWEVQKAAERAARAEAAGTPAEAGILAGLPLALPALTRAVKLTRRAGRVGFDWPDAPAVLEKLAEETAELAHEIAAGAPQARLADELGDVLFVLANLARKLDLDPEAALRGANAKFERRFGHIEARLAAAGRHPAQSTLAEMEALWQEAKRAERAAPAGPAAPAKPDEPASG